MCFDSDKLKTHLLNHVSQQRILQVAQLFFFKSKIVLKSQLYY